MKPRLYALILRERDRWTDCKLSFHRMASSSGRWTSVTCAATWCVAVWLDLSGEIADTLRRSNTFVSRKTCVKLNALLILAYITPCYRSSTLSKRKKQKRERGEKRKAIEIRQGEEAATEGEVSHDRNIDCSSYSHYATRTRRTRW